MWSTHHSVLWHRFQDRTSYILRGKKKKNSDGVDDVDDNGREKQDGLEKDDTVTGKKNRDVSGEKESK